MQNFVGNLRMAHKFVLVACIAVVMLAVPSTMVIKQGYDHLQATNSGVRGLPPAGATLELIRLTQQHRGLSNGMLAGNSAMVAPREAKSAEVQKAVVMMQARVAALADAALVRNAAQLGGHWKQLAEEVAAKSLPGAQSFARHTALIAEQLRLLEDIANASGIVFEDDPAPYFLQAAMLRSTPMATEALGQMRARGSALLTQGSATAEDKARFDALVQQYRRARTDSGRLLDGVGRHDPAMKEALAPVLAQAQQSSDAAMKLVAEQILQADTLSFAPMDYFAATTRAIDDEFKLIDAGFKLLDDNLTDAARQARNGLIALALGLVAMAGLAGWVMWLATRTTTRAVAGALRLAQDVAAGDLRSRLQPRGKDEIASLLKALVEMNQGLAHVVTGVRRNAESVAAASAEIAQGNLDLSSRTEQQAAALEQTAATMDELGSTVRSTAEHAREASTLAQGASEVAQRGSVAMDAVVQTMRGINESSRHIADITGTIDSIAFQTNILALNAAVEAARAGDEGRGFAVVASEVRHLAQRAAEAARQIKQLIGVSVQSVERGTEQVDQAGATMGEVVVAIQRVRGIVAEISSASSEQSTGVSQVGEAVTQMDHATQQNAALVEESAAAAASLRAQAEQLVQMVSAFKLADDGVPALAGAR